RAIFRCAEKLPAAHVLSVRADNLRASPRRYWRLEFAADESVSVEQWEEAIRAKLCETVRLHLLADVPLGAFLSGGVDSSFIVAEATGQAGALQTFSIGFQEDAFSELPFAREVA